MYKKEKEILSKMINEFSMVNSKKEILNKYKWYSLASGIKNDKLVYGLLKELLSDLRGNI